jgi:hypothetical protein
MISQAELQAGRDRVIEELEKGFPILNICDVMDWIYYTFEPNKKQWEMPYDWETEKLKEFSRNFGVFLYEKPREDYFPQLGILEAEERGYRGVILSDLS